MKTDNDPGRRIGSRRRTRHWPPTTSVGLGQRRLRRLRSDDMAVPGPTLALGWPGLRDATDG